jgi:sugar lactone lactonase YvrE
VRAAEILYPGRAELAEGPSWHQGALWWVDIVSGTLNRLDVGSGFNTARSTGDFLSAAVPAREGRWLLALQRRCAFFDWETGALTEFVRPGEVGEGQRLNDGKCDRAGRLWLGTLSFNHEKNAAVLLRIDARGKVDCVQRGLTLANGLTWAADGRRFYHIDTPTRRIGLYDFDPEGGTISGRRTLTQFTEQDGMPDGMTSDAEGNLWVALWGGAAIARVDGVTGAVLEKHPLPVSQVSSCTFGGGDLGTLYITTAWENMSLDQRRAQPLAGSIFALRTDTQGLPVLPFGAA